MKRIDHNYVAELVKRAQLGSSNGFAELYTATYEMQYSYACEYLADAEKAKKALHETYRVALMELSKLKQPEIGLAWLNQLNFQACYAMEHDTEDVQIKNKKYHVNQLIKNIPMTEAQVLLMSYYHGYRTGRICKLLGLSRIEVWEYRKSGRKHLADLLQEHEL